MKEYTLSIVGHSADLKTSPTGSKDTGIFFPQDLIDFLGPNKNYSFRIYKEDCAKAMAAIISSLPLYSNKGGNKITHSRIYDEANRLMSMITSFFGNNDIAIYSGFNLTQTTGGRRYLYGLEQNGFSIRKFLVADHSILKFQIDDDGSINLRFQTRMVTTQLDSEEEIIPNPPQDASEETNDNPYRQYIAAIKTKPFLILGGFSGTGKSQKVKELAFATCPCDGVLNVSETSPGNYLLVSVKPNWHDATDITGFRSSVNKNYYVTDFMRFLVKAKQYEEQHVPFFVCLDEMNLAPVEEYFADFLSVIESRKRRADGKIVTDAIVPASVFNDTGYAADFNIFMQLGLELTNPDWKADDVSALDAEEQAQAFVRQDIVEELKRDGLTIPSNVIIIGTVNMDDTTNSFSRKVIDRAMTFETIVGEFGEDYFEGDVALNYIKNPRKGELFLSDEVRATQMLTEGRFTLTKKEQTAILGFINGINEDLEGSPFKISYRILNETILLYRSKKRIAEIMEAEGGFEEDVEFDTDLNTIFDEILMQKVLPRIEGDYEKCNKCLTKLSTRAADNDWLKSSKKIEFMIKRFGTDKSGFTTFWN